MAIGFGTCFSVTLMYLYTYMYLTLTRLCLLHVCLHCSIMHEVVYIFGQQPGSGVVLDCIDS